MTNFNDLYNPSPLVLKGDIQVDRAPSVGKKIVCMLGNKSRR